MKKGKKHTGNPDFRQPISELVDELKAYVNLQLEYNKAAYRKKTAELLGQLMLYMMLLGVSVFVLMFLSFAFVNWYAAQGGTRMGGFLWVTAFYFYRADNLCFQRVAYLLDIT